MENQRYQRQMLVKDFGEEGQRIIHSKKIVLIGAGGLGSHSASLLVRFGIGEITIVDHDVVELSNLHRTAVFSEQDVGKSKATVLAEKLKNVNHDVVIKSSTIKVTKETVVSLVSGADLLVDGTDNFEARYLLNDVAIKRAVPWVYAGVYYAMGMVLGIVPGKTACFSCVSQTIPSEPDDMTPVLGFLPAVIASLQCGEIIKMLLGRIPSGLLVYDGWSQSLDVLQVKKNPGCGCCSKQRFTYLEG